MEEGILGVAVVQAPVSLASEREQVWSQTLVDVVVLASGTDHLLAIPIAVTLACRQCRNGERRNRHQSDAAVPRSILKVIASSPKSLLDPATSATEGSSFPESRMTSTTSDSRAENTRHLPGDGGLQRGQVVLHIIALTAALLALNAGACCYDCPPNPLCPDARCCTAEK